MNYYSYIQLCTKELTPAFHLIINNLILHTLFLPSLFTSNFAHPTLHTPTFHTKLTKCSPFYTFCVWGNPTHPGARFATHWYSRPALGTRKRPATGKPKMPAPGARRCPVTGDQRCLVVGAWTCPHQEPGNGDPRKAKFSSLLTNLHIHCISNCKIYAN